MLLDLRWGLAAATAKAATAFLVGVASERLNSEAIVPLTFSRKRAAA
jgi:hypothetical protein